MMRQNNYFVSQNKKVLEQQKLEIFESYNSSGGKL